jgi:hypothetical protein
VKPDPFICCVLAGACWDHENVSLARKVIDHVHDQMEPGHEGITYSVFFYLSMLTF